MTRSEIKFKAKNGSCPEFQYGNIRWYIQDHHNEAGWIYTLYQRVLKSTVKSMSEKELIKYLNEQGAQLITSRHDMDYYTNVKTEFRVNKNTGKLTESPRPVEVSKEFRTKGKCLSFALEWISSYIKLNEPQQLEIVIVEEELDDEEDEED